MERVPRELRRVQPGARSLSVLLSSLELSDTKVYEPSMRARLGTAAHFCAPSPTVHVYSFPLLHWVGGQGVGCGVRGEGLMV